MKNNMTSEGKLYFKAPPAVDDIVFHDETNSEVGRLSWKTGKFVFTGKADKSAKIFFEDFLKPYIDGYINQRLNSKI